MRLGQTATRVLLLKFALEYNDGSEYWVAMALCILAKRGTRGNAYEAYAIWDFPSGEAISKYAKTFMRIGFIHYDFDYSGGMDFNMKPADLDDSMEAATAAAFGQATPTSADQIYITMEAYF